MKVPVRMLMLAGGLFVLGTVTASAQAGTVTCKDGTKSKAGQGACSGHGGIAPAGETRKEMKAERKAEKAEKKADEKMETKAEKKMEKAEKKAERAEAKAEKKTEKAEKKAEKAAAVVDASDKDAKGAVAECKDHTFSHSKTRQGACSGHGGVLKWLSAR